jgi:hypothetical protein
MMDRLGAIVEDTKASPRGGLVTVRVGASVNLQAAALDPGAWLPPGREREVCRHARVKIDLGLGPDDL